MLKIENRELKRSCRSRPFSISKTTKSDFLQNIFDLENTDIEILLKYNEGNILEVSIFLSKIYRVSKLDYIIR